MVGGQVCEGSKMNIGKGGGTRHGYRGASRTRCGVYERAVYRFYEGGKPLAHARGAEKGERRIWSRISDVAEREKGDHDGKAHLHQSFSPDGNYWHFPERHGGHGAAGGGRRAQVFLHVSESVAP